MTDGEKKGKEFLDYVGKNINRLKKNLKKNITYDDELFDDVFNESIIKVYNSIVKNNKTVEDYEQYFYISSKFNYIIKQNQERKRKNNRINIDDFMIKNDIEMDVYEYMDVAYVINELRTIIENEFGEEQTNIYFDYMGLKIHGNMSYQKYSKMTEIPITRITEIISKIKSFCKTNEAIRRYNYALDI